MSDSCTAISRNRLAHLGEEQNELGIHIRSISQHGVTVHTGVLKVDARFAIRADDNL